MRVLVFLLATDANAGPHFSAEAALDRRDEVDVEGWKVGDPYVLCAFLVEHEWLVPDTPA